MQHTLYRDQVLRGLHALCQNLPLIRILLFSLFVLLALSACSANAGVLAGGTWQSAGLSHRHIHVLTVDANNPQAIYAGDEQGQVFASNDGGLHWTAHTINSGSTPNTVRALSFDVSGKRLYAATDQGIFASTDEARHWDNVGTPASGLPAVGYVSLAFDLNAVHTIYAASKTAILISQNDGQRWTSISNSLPGAISINNIVFDTDNHFLWVATAQGIYRYNTRNATWQTLNTGLPAGAVVYTVQPASTSGGTAGLIFAGTNQGFFRSVDAGLHWAESQQSLARTNIYTLLVDFRQPATVFVGTDIGVLRSDDNGQNWSGIASGLPGKQPVYALALGASNYAQLFAANSDVYLFPGTSGGLNVNNLLPILLVLLLFYLLYRLTRRNRQSKQHMLKPERIIEQPSSVVDNDLPGKNHAP